ncbi:MAG: prolyl oligopeptidase family serine peptidase [Pseudomonadota bacterium]
MPITQIALITAGVVVLLFAVGIAFSARMMIAPGRTALWTDPEKAADIPYQNVEFPAADGTSLKGWFLPARYEGRAPTLLMLHGWPWNRLGTLQKSLINHFPGGKRVELMPLVKAYHEAGYAQLLFDIRNFGESMRNGVYTAGWKEHLDLLGALDYLDTRPDVDPDRIGAIGFSNGGNCIVFALAHTDRLKVGIAVQPTTVAGFMKNFTKPFGPIGKVLGWGTQIFYSLAGGPKLETIQPVHALRGAAATPMLYVQSTGDKWGSVDDVKRMIAATPVAEGLFPETTHRFDGYIHMVKHPEVSLGLFAKHLSIPGDV